MFQDGTFGGITDAHGAFSSGAEGTAGCEADFRFEEQLAAELEGIGETFDFRGGN